MAGRPIDEKIVVMKLDNSDFQKKAVETTSIFGKLRDALNRIPGVNLGKTTQELGKIQSAANNTNLNGLANSINNVASRFSNLGVVATTTLATITNQAVNAGMQLGKSLTIDQVTSGFNEYELKIGAIGTMLSNTEWEGGNLKSISAVLEDLNAYADNTVYNFGQMTENIGRFTAAGVGMKDSAIAIKGLSNLAAASGSNTEQLNTAMYQMSQSLASGKLNLMDWNSLVNAGMAGKKTQDALLETAKAMGVNVDQSKSFRDSISDGWLTSEVFLATLKKFGEDKSMTEAATAVRTFSGMMDSLKESIGSGWASTFELIFGDFNEATKLWTGLSTSITGFFSKSTKERNDFIKGLADKGGIDNIFKGLQNAVKPLGQIFKAMGDGFAKVFPPKSVNQVMDMTKSFVEFTKGLAFSKGETKQLTTIFQGAFSIFSSVWEIAKRLGQAFMKLIPNNAGSGFLGLLENLAQLAIGFNKSLKEGNALTGIIDGLGFILGGLGTVIGDIITVVGSFGSAIKNNIGKVIDWLKAKLAPLGGFFKESFGGLGGEDLLGAGAIAGIVLVVKKITGVFDNFGDIAENVAETFEGVKDAVQNFAMGIKIGNLLLIAIAIGILASSLKVMEGIKVEDLTKGITALAVALAVMIGGMMIIDKFKVTGGLRASFTIIAMAMAVNIMAQSLERIADLNPEQLKKGIYSLAGIMAVLAGAMIAMSKWGGKIGTSSLSLLALAGAVYILADAVDKMARIKTGKLFTAIGALALIFAQIAIFLKVVNSSKLSVASALGILITAAAIQVMVGAVNKLSGLNIKQLAKGLGAIAILLAEIVLFSRLSGGPQMLAAGVGLLIISGAINALVIPIEKLGKMSMGTLAKGLISMAIALAAVVAAGIMATGAIGGAAAIAVMAIALNLLVIPIEKLGKMSLWELVKGLGGLALGMTLLALAATLLTPAVPSMLAFGAGLFVIGAAVALAGAGIALFGMGLVTLATLTATSITAIIAALALFIKGLMDLIPAVVDFAVKLGVALIQGIVALAIPLGQAIAQLIIGLLNVITTYLPQFIQMGTKLIVQLLEGMGQAIPTIVDAAIGFIIDIINGMSAAVAENGPELISAFMTLMGELIILVIEAGSQTINALFGWIPGVKEATASIGTTAADTIRANFGASAVGADKGKEFAGALRGKSGDAKSAGSSVGKAGQDGAKGANLKTVGTTKGQDFATALASAQGKSKSSGTSLANAGKTGAGSVNMSSTGTNFGLGFANGINNGTVLGRVASAALSIAKAAKSKVESWLDMHSPSKEMEKDGGFFSEGFAIGIKNKAKLVANNAKGIAVTAKDSLNRFMNGFELPTDSNEIRFKAVIDYEKADVSRFGNLGSLAIAPDMSLTNGLITATKSEIRQNNYKPQTVKVSKPTNDQPTDNVSKQPIIVQSVLNGRVLAEELVEDVTKIQNTKQNAINRARGEY